MLAKKNKEPTIKVQILLWPVTNTFVFPLAGYSKKIKSVADLQNGSQIAIPNDVTNGGRALLLLQEQKLIRLRDNVGYTPTIVDIVENSKKLKIVELEAPQLPRVLDDEQVAVAVINNTYCRTSRAYLEGCHL